MNNLPIFRIGHYRFYALLVPCVALLASTTLLVQSRQIQPKQAKSADSFINSIGVNVHLPYTGGVYGKYNEVIKPRLQELGVRHIRDNSVKDPAFYQKLNDLAAVGIKSTLIVDVERYQPAEAVALAKAVPDSLVAIEGPNERDLFGGFNYKGQGYPQGVRAYQSDLYSAIKGDPATAHLSVLKASLQTPSNVSKVGFSFDSFDKGNIHYYHGVEPAFNLDNSVIPSVKKVTGDKPIVVTETGWSNVSQQVEAKYVPRLYLEHFNRGIERTFLYELHNQGINNDPESNFGLLNYDGSPQPAFRALKNTIDLLKDPGSSFPLKSLGYTITGSTLGIHQTLLQKRDGVFYLVLWRDAKSWDDKHKKAITVPKQKVTVTLNTAIGEAGFYLPSFSRAPTWQSTNRHGHFKRFRLTVPDHPLIVKLVPASRT